MAALPSPTQVAGGHSAIYEAYYNQVDPTHQGSISAPVAAKFLKKSGLSDIILSKIWDLSDPTGKGCLNRGGFFVALKLCALAQSGKAVNMVNMNCETPPPKMGELPNVLPTSGAPAKPPQPVHGMPSTEWTVQPTERAKYDKLFDSLEPANGLLQGNKVRGVMVNSKLPMPTLGKIWDLADMDKDGMLDRHEFTVAMHLVYKALEKYTIPASLPPELMRPKPPIPAAPGIAMQPQISNKPPAIPPMPQIAPIIPQLPLAPSPVPGAVAAVAPPAPMFTSPNTVHWVVSPEDRNRFEARFRLADKDKDGFVSGGEIKDIFLQSGVPPPLLAHIWGLCDTHQSGKLNLEQFALAMWFIEQTLKGVKPPATLAPDMVPPCMRPKVAAGAEAAPGAGQQPEGASNQPYANNPELDMISREIDELAREKRTLETDIAQKEADIKIKSGEIKSLQSELDTLAATLKQLENQKGEAQKRLNDLKGQKTTLDKEVSDIKLLLEEENNKVAQLRSQADEQERGLKVQEDELNSRRQELEGLKQEETRLETMLQQSRSQFDGLHTNLQDTQLLISQAKAKITQLEEQQRQMNDNLAVFDTVLTSGDASSVSDSSLAPASTEFRDPEFVRFAMVNGGSPPAEKNDAFPSQDPFNGTNGNTERGGFGNEDAFSNNDQFKSSQTNGTRDPFGDPFASSFPANNQSSGFGSDPFAAAFGGDGGGSGGFGDPFGEQGGTSKTPVDMAGKDPFGCDPFAAPSPAPTPSPGPPLPPLPGSAGGRGTDSPTPALPPKKSKQPPPRPAPPKSVLRAAPQPPLPPSPSPEPNSNSSGGDAFGRTDPFSNATSDPFSSGGFANFADFDSKSQEDSGFANVVNNNNNVSNEPKVSSQHNNYNNAANSPPITPPAPARTSSKGRYAGMDFTEDPFRDYRYEDPFDIEDPFENQPISEISKPKLSSKSPVTPRPPSGSDEEKQVAWAAAESVRVEEERKQRLQQQEQADLEFALALSRSEATAGGK